MKAYLKGIAVFKSEEDKRVIRLEEGLNIITGLSQTGKSAIYDIVDWCLGSDKFVIPKGVISKYAQLYAILFNIKGITYLIARKGEYEKRLMYFQTVSDDLSIRDLKLSDFKEDYFDITANVLIRLEEAFNLKIGDSNIQELDYYKDTKRIGIRSSLSFIYQHQGVIADKFDLFFYKPIKSYFPVLSDWKAQEDFAREKELEKLKQNLDKQKKHFDEVKAHNEFLELNLKNAFSSYLTIIGDEIIDDFSIEFIFEQIKKFPDKIVFKNPDKLAKRQATLVELLKPLRKEKMRLSKETGVINEAKREGANIQKWLKTVKTKEAKNNKNICPICNTPNAELNEIAYKIYDAERWIEEELEIISNTDHSFEHEIARIESEMSKLSIQISKLQGEYDINEELINQVLKEKPIEESIFYAQRRVIAEANFYKEKRIKSNDKDIALLADRVDKIHNLVSNSSKNVAENFQDAKTEIEAIMNFIVSELYFEHQPPNLKFELNPSNKDNYELYHYDEQEEDKIYMSQMGSASNYLACHLGLFVSFLCYFSLRDNSKVPSMLFLDQPSQVYFTSGKKLEEDDDIARVKKIYDTLLEWISYIYREKKFRPQIIVSDHIEHLGENSEYLKKYFRANWRDGDGFI